MHIFLISLPDPPQRRASAVGKLRSSGLRFEIVDGVEAKKWRTDAIPFAVDAWPGLTPGQAGCYLAHLRALRRIIDYDLNWACVLEDDFCFEADPDVGLAELETTFPADFHYLHLQRDLSLNRELRIGERSGFYERIFGTPLCATGYVITRPLAEYVLEHHSQMMTPMDHLYSMLSHRGHFYRLVKPLVGIQEGLPSVSWS